VVWVKTRPGYKHIRVTGLLVMVIDLADANPLFFGAAMEDALGCIGAVAQPISVVVKINVVINTKDFILLPTVLKAAHITRKILKIY
jgi:hypothetical protein